jgi:hypothetical protein
MNHDSGELLLGGITNECLFRNASSDAWCYRSEDCISLNMMVRSKVLILIRLVVLLFKSRKNRTRLYVARGTLPRIQEICLESSFDAG